MLFVFVFTTSTVKAEILTDTIRLEKELKEVNVDGRNQKLLRSAMPVQVISTEDIENLNANNIADVAKHFAGVTIKDFGGIGGLKTISVRGLGGAHTAVSFDGLVMSEIQSGQIDLSQFCVENISSVSLDNGQPMNLLNPARMFASSAVLTLKTKTPVYDSLKSFSGITSVKAGSFGMVNPSFLINKNFTPKLAATLSLNGITANGEYPYKVNVNPYGINYVENVRKNSDVTSLHSEADLFYNFTSQEIFSLKVNHYYSNRGIPGSVTFYNYDDADGRITDNNLLSQFYYENKNRKHWQYLVSGKYNRQNMLYTETDINYSTLPDNKRTETYLQNEYYLSSALQYRPFENLTLATAVDGWYNNLFSTSNLNLREDAQPERVTILANFSAKYVTEHFTVGGNLLYTRTHETSDSTTSVPDRNKLSPTVYSTFQLTDAGNLSLRAFYKEIYRLPTFTELYYHDLGYKYLLPEETHQFNLGLTYLSDKIPFINSFMCTADAFYNRVTNKITIIYGMPYSSVRNTGQVEIKGCDIGISAEKVFDKNNRLQLNANYTFQLAQNVDKNSETYGDIIPYTPIHSGSASLTYSYKNLEFGYNLIFSGKRYSGQNSDINNYLAPYADQSIFGRYTYKKLKFTAEILNFTNVNYAVVKFYPMPGRNYRFGISYKF